MFIRNDGQDDINILQNCFTAYLVVAVRRKRVQYLRARNQRRYMEELSDPLTDYRLLQMEDTDTVSCNLSFLEQIESKELIVALRQMKEQEFFILTMRVLENLSFREIAERTNLNINTVSAIYYRALKKLRKQILEG